MALEAGASISDCEDEESTPFPLNKSFFCVLNVHAYNNPLSYDEIERIGATVALLFKIAFLISFMDSKKRTPVSHIARSNLPSTTAALQVLVKHGADPTIKDDYGHDALYAVVAHGRCNDLYMEELRIDPTEFNDL